MARTRRILTRSGDQFDTSGEEWEDNTSLDLSATAFQVVDLPFSLGFASGPITRIVIWEDGFISLGDVTQAQIDWVAAHPPPAGKAGFPGDYIEAGRVDVQSDVQNITYAAGSIDFEPDPGVDPPYSRGDAVDIFRITWTTPDFGLFQIQLTHNDLAVIDPTVASSFEPVVPFGFRIGDYMFDPFAEPTPDYFLNSTLGGFYEGDVFANVIGGTERADIILGRGGNDQLHGNLGADVLQGMGGKDALFGDVGNDRLTGGSEDDMLDGGAGSDQMNGNAGLDNLLGGGGNDLLFGESGHDHLYGHAGDDFLFGGDNRDTIFGGDGDDLIEGGAQRDVLGGGGGADNFRFFDGDTGATRLEADSILNFSRTQGDKINLHPIDANTGLAGNQAFRFIGDQAFTGHAGDLRYHLVNGEMFIQGDTNGDKVADLFIAVDGLPEPAASDFIL